MKVICTVLLETKSLSSTTFECKFVPKLCYVDLPLLGFRRGLSSLLLARAVMCDSRLQHPFK